MYILSKEQATKLEETTFSELGMKESDIEEILRKNIDVLCDDEESMLIVGQQVKNAMNGRSDLTAINDSGDIVLIEIKRDKSDIISRKEPFEFQAIRYAASCATLKSTDELIQRVFSPYVEKHKDEFDEGMGLTSSEIAKRKLADFLEKNSVTTFNEHQRIILVASEFDEQTLSAIAWLNSNNVDICCYQVCPYKFCDTIFLDMKKLLPVVSYEDYYVNIAGKDVILQKGEKKNISRRSLPKIDTMLEWGLVKSGDILVAKGTDSKAELLSDGKVKTSTGEICSIQQWLKSVFKWSSIQTYLFVVLQRENKTLSELRELYMSNHQIDI